jgi:hypothetical protein
LNPNYWIGCKIPTVTVYFITEAWWNFPYGIPVPKNLTAMKCGVCGSHNPIIRNWHFHQRPAPSRTIYRCNVRMKCQECAAVWPHGVVLTEKQYEESLKSRKLLGLRSGTLTREQFIAIHEARKNES